MASYPIAGSLPQAGSHGQSWLPQSAKPLPDLRLLLSTLKERLTSQLICRTMVIDTPWSSLPIFLGSNPDVLSNNFSLQKSIFAKLAVIFRH